jgi:hypothetical protein
MVIHSRQSKSTANEDGILIRHETRVNATQHERRQNGCAVGCSCCVSLRVSSSLFIIAC